ncbi:MAG: hypothetical protein AAFR21_17335 [Pseudomonadota bacterium]
MKIDIEAYKRFHERGKLVRGDFGDARETACAFSSLTGQTGFNGCAAAGWPRWLAELCALIFDNAPEELSFQRGLDFAYAVKAAEDRGADWDRVFRDIRLKAVLPIAMEAIGDGDEPWHEACRIAVQWSIDNDGKANPNATWAAWAAGAAEAAGAAWAALAAGAAGAAAHTRIFEATIEALRGET